eukprot:5885905-Heterocapsa_arctica.AAC.1
MIRPNGDVRFPMKSSWDITNLSLDGKRASLGPNPGFNELFGRPPAMRKDNVEGDAGNGVVPLVDAGNGIDPVVPDPVAEELAEDALDLQGGL